MNKNFKIVQIHGLSGLLILGFVFTGLFCGFIVFPIWAVMEIWNYLVGQMIEGPIINYYQSTLLWLAVLLIIYIYFKNNISIRIQKEEKINPADIKEIISELKEKEDSSIKEIKDTDTHEK